MNRKEVIVWIDQIEQEYPVDEWVINGLHLWPIIRVIASFYFVEKADNTRVVIEPPPSPVTFRQKIRWLLASTRFLFSLRPVDFVFVGAFAQRVMHQGRWFNRFTDPVVDDLASAGFSLARLEYDDIPSELTAPLYQDDRVVFLKEVAYPFQLLEKLIRVFRPRCHCLPMYHDFLQSLSENPATQGLRHRISHQKIEHFVEEVAYYQRFFRYYLKRVQPRLLIGVCYYSYPLYGAIAAAHEQKIASVDLQHGPQSGIHAAYVGFKKVPLNGYSTLPKIFWVWNQGSENNLERWIKHQTFHQVKQWGHPWVRYWLKKGITATAPDKPIVLYSLQPVGALVEEFVIEAISRSTRIYQWHLRLHPRQQYAKAELVALLKQKGLTDTVTIDDGLHEPLPEVLAKASVHLTRFSGTALEAAMFNVPTIFLDPTAAHCFSDLIASKKAVYVEFTNEQQLLRTIEDSLLYERENNYPPPSFSAYSELLIDI